MIRLGNIKIGIRLGLGFAALIALLLLMTAFSIHSLGKINDQTQNIAERTYFKIKYANDAQRDMREIMSNIQLMLLKGGKDVQPLREAVAKLRASYKVSMEKLEQLETTERGKELLEQVKQSIVTARGANNTVDELSKTGKNAEAIEHFNHVATPLVDTIFANFATLVRFEEGLMDEAQREALATYQTTWQVMLAVAVLAVLFAVAIGVVVTRSITVPIAKGVHLAETVAKGNLDLRLRLGDADEIGQLADALDLMADTLKRQADIAGEISRGNLAVEVQLASEQDQLGTALAGMTVVLNDVMRQVMVAADNVASGSQALSTSSQQMSQGATEQAASAEEASSSIEEMAANIRQNTENAVQTERIATQAAQAIRKAGAAAAENMVSMKEIAGKITIIEEIARQTNLLALNAAIEAARAGEHGKGFAVVAAEVRKLAERSQMAAAEINKLSLSSVDVAERAGNMLQEVVPGIQRTAELVQEIAAASREQDCGSEQIAKAILQLDQVIQQNASATEEMASTAEELSGQSEQLQEMVAFFTVKGIDTAQRTPHKRPHRGGDSPAVTAHHGRHGDSKGAKRLEIGGRDHRDDEFERF